MASPRNNLEEPQAGGCVDLQPGDYVDVALDASCAALMALDLVRTFAAEDERVTRRVSIAIAALRQAIADLREQQGASGRAASKGFVCGGRIDDPARHREGKPHPRFQALR